MSTAPAPLPPNRAAAAPSSLRRVAPRSPSPRSASRSRPTLPSHPIHGSGAFMADKPLPLLLRGFEEPLGLDLKADLKHGDAAAKAKAMKHAIVLLIDGDGGMDDFRDLPGIILSYVLPCEDVKVQMLVLLYLEILYKKGEGDLLLLRLPSLDDVATTTTATTLVRDQLRKNLYSRNKHICAATLRLISRLQDPDLLQPPLAEIVFTNLFSRRRFVRRYASPAFTSLYLLRTPDGRQIVDDPEGLIRCVVEVRLDTERDPEALRNAFLMLCACAPRRAVDYLLANADHVAHSWPVIVQTEVINFILGLCDDERDSRLIGILMSLLCSASSKSLLNEGAGVVACLSSDPEAAQMVRTAAAAYVGLLLSPHTDDNVRSIVLGRLLELTLRFCVSMHHNHNSSSSSNTNGEPCSLASSAPSSQGSNE